MRVISMFVLVDTPLTGAFAFLRERRFDGRCSRRDGGRGALCAAPPPSECKHLLDLSVKRGCGTSFNLQFFVAMGNII